MATNTQTVKIFMMPQTFPCGPKSSCCGPVGQTEEQVQNLKSGIEKALGCPVEVISVAAESELKKHVSVQRLVRSFGPMALPIIAVNDEVVSMGNAAPEQAVSAVKDKMKKQA